MNKRSSLQDIADKLGISRTTVSWVLAGKGNEHHISVKTQEKVRNCAKELNYNPNLIAKTLRVGKTHSIGLIIPSIVDQFYSEVAKEIEREAYKHGYTLTLGSSESDHERESTLIQIFKDKLVDGLIIAPTEHSKVEIQNLSEQSFPFVLFDRHYPELDTNYVIIDNEKAGYELTRHLIEKGCKKIAVININKHLLAIQHRLQGYKRALAENGLSFNENLIAEMKFATYQTKLYEALDRIMCLEPDVDGFYFTSHILAIETINYFHSQGIDFNGRFKMASIHEVPMMNIVAPKISIARMPAKVIGQEAVRLLLDAIDNKDEVIRLKGIVLPTLQIFRD
ncbi:MAG: LacI family DNA-binding transcriptional regulator [Mangrovibacterium sp.]